jgi:TPR repeat protein
VWRQERLFQTGRCGTALLSDRRNGGNDRLVQATAGVTVKISVFIAMAVLTVVIASPAAGAPLDDAVAAERRDECGTAVPIYRALAAKGVAAADSRLGYFYDIGYCVKRDWIEAAKWYGKAIDAGDDAAAAALSGIGRNWRFMYLNVPMDPTIYGLIEKAAKGGSAVAQFSLGVMNYPIGDPTFDESKGNLNEALIWYRRGADQGDIDSQAALALAYRDGLGVPQDFVEAHKWYNLAASHVKYADIRSDLIKRRDDLATKMTAAQIADAQKLAREWKASK